MSSPPTAPKVAMVSVARGDLNTAIGLAWDNQPSLTSCEALFRLEAALATPPAQDELPLGGPVDPHFRPTRKDLIALRKDYKDLESGDGTPPLEGLAVRVHVAPAVLYMAWPNSQYKPDDGSDPYRCISFHIPKPESTHD